jgi:hypothetical protein
MMRWAVSRGRETNEAWLADSAAPRPRPHGPVDATRHQRGPRRAWALPGQLRQALQFSLAANLECDGVGARRARLSIAVNGQRRLTLD